MEEEEKTQKHLGEIEEMKAIIEKDKVERVERCKKELEELLRKYNCLLDVQAILSQQGTRFMVNLIAKE